jgi:hypothetical protein
MARRLTGVGRRLERDRPYVIVLIEPRVDRAPDDARHQPDTTPY